MAREGRGKTQNKKQRWPAKSTRVSKRVVKCAFTSHHPAHWEGYSFIQKTNDSPMLPDVTFHVLIGLFIKNEYFHWEDHSNVMQFG